MQKAISKKARALRPRQEGLAAAQRDAAPAPKEEPAVAAPDAKAISTTKPKEDNKSKFDDAMKRLQDMEKQTADDYKGKGDPNGSRKGTVSEFTQQMIGMQWVSDVQDRIRPNFAAPSVIAENERNRLATIVLIFVDGRGRILKREIEKSSGNALFDNAVLHAFDASNPLPAPPSELREQIARDGVEITFLGKKS